MVRRTKPSLVTEDITHSAAAAASPAASDPSALPTDASTLDPVLSSAARGKPKPNPKLAEGVKPITGKPTAKKTAQRAAIYARRRLVAANILAGVDYRTIAENQKVSITTIANDAKHMLAQWHKQAMRDMAEAQTLQLRRLDVLLNAIWDKARDGSLDELNVALKIMEMQNKILGVGTERPLVNLNIDLKWPDEPSEAQHQLDSGPPEDLPDHYLADMPKQPVETETADAIEAEFTDIADE